MISIGQMLKLLASPEKVPDLICSGMPGHALALALMDANQYLSQVSTDHAFLCFKLIARAIAEKRDLSEAEGKEMALASNKVLMAAFDLQELAKKPITIETLARMAALR